MGYVQYTSGPATPGTTSQAWSERADLRSRQPVVDTTAWLQSTVVVSLMAWLVGKLRQPNESKGRYSTRKPSQNQLLQVSGWLTRRLESGYLKGIFSFAAQPTFAGRLCVSISIGILVGALLTVLTSIAPLSPWPSLAIAIGSSVAFLSQDGGGSPSGAVVRASVAASGWRLVVAGFLGRGQCCQRSLEGRTGRPPSWPRPLGRCCGRRVGER